MSHMKKEIQEDKLKEDNEEWQRVEGTLGLARRLISDPTHSEKTEFHHIPLQVYFLSCTGSIQQVLTPHTLS